MIQSLPHDNFYPTLPPCGLFSTEKLTDISDLFSAIIQAESIWMYTIKLYQRKRLTFIGKVKTIGTNGSSYQKIENEKVIRCCLSSSSSSRGGFWYIVIKAGKQNGREINKQWATPSGQRKRPSLKVNEKWLELWALPRHIPPVQLADVRSRPTQYLPPFEGEGLVHERRRWCLQSGPQLDQLVQALHRPSTTLVRESSYYQTIGIEEISLKYRRPATQ